jgi:hypothetical protein
LQTSFKGGYDRKHAGTRLKVEVTSRLPLHGKPSLRSGWKRAVTSPGLALPGIPSGGFIERKRIRISRLKLLPDRPASFAPLGAPMEGLIELVAASFARHGIECPAGDSQWTRPVQTKSVQPRLIETKSAQAVRPAEPTLTTALPEHNYPKSSQADPVP